MLTAPCEKACVEMGRNNLKLCNPPPRVLYKWMVCGLLSMMASGLFPAIVYAQATIPANTPIEVRLTERVSTQHSKKGAAVHAILAAPVMAGDEILLPLGTKVTGTVVEVNRVRLGFRHETSSIGLALEQIILPDGTHVSLAARVAQIEDAREVIDKRGRIAGVRSTSTLSHKASGVLGALALNNPIALIFATASSASLLRFSDPEITLPANTELVLLTTAPLTVQAGAESTILPVAEGSESQQALAVLLRKQAYRTVTEQGSVPSDVTNIMFIGSDEALVRAFLAAGWLEVDSLSADSTYRIIRSFSEQQAYRTAPMSTLLLEDEKPAHSLAKTLDTFSKRHHIRIFATIDAWEGEPVWVASATQDIGIGFSISQKGLLHEIDRKIDHERTKIVNDLLLTGCVTGLNLVQRPWVPSGLKNGTGEEIITDKEMAVLRIGDCHDPMNVPAVAETAVDPISENPLLKVTRQTNLTLRNMALRDNAVVTAYTGIKAALGLKHPKPPEQPLEVSSALDAGKYRVALDPGRREHERAKLDNPPQEPAATRAPITKQPLHKPRTLAPYSVELGLHGGFASFAGGNGGAVGYLFVPENPSNQSAILLALANEHKNGWTMGGSVTLDTRQHFSHEIRFDYNRTGFKIALATLDLSTGPEATDPGTAQDFAFREVKLSTTEVSYNLQYHLLGRESRWRPYVFAGPSLRLLHLTEAPIKKASPWFRLGLSTVGSFLAAYELGSTPPLEGGGIFQVGVQYGGGIKYRISRSFIIRADYRETLTTQPDFWSKSKDDIFSAADLPGYSLNVIGPIKEGNMRQQRATLGVSFLF